MQAQVVRVGLGLAPTEPGGPPEPPARTEPYGWNFIFLEPQPDIPVQLEVRVQAHPVHQLAQARAPGQEILVLTERQRTDMKPELVLLIPDAAAGHRRHAEYRPIAPQIGALGRLEPHPVA